MDRASGEEVTMVKSFCLMDKIYKKMALIESSEPIRHLRNAKKEVLFAMRALIDAAIDEIEKKNRKAEGKVTTNVVESNE